MAREWVARGHDVDVVTGPGDRGGEWAPDLIPLAEGSGATVHRAPAPGIPTLERRAAFEKGSPVRVARPIPRWRQILGQWKSFPDASRSWIRPAVRLALQLHSRRDYDLVWSTSPPESVHFVARSLAKTGLPWVADFRDQWSDYVLARWDPISRFAIDRLSAVILKPAAAVTSNTQGVARSIGAGSVRVVSCIYNGFDPVSAAGRPIRFRTLGYFGRIDPLFQHPERLWPSLRRLRAEGRAWKVEFYAVPGGGGGAHLEIPEDLRQTVRILPPLPHAEALQRMQEMTALLLLAWETRGGEAALSGKVFEYVGSGRPILVCAPGGYEARTLVEDSGTGLSAWSTEELVESFTALERFAPSPRGRARLARSEMAAEMLALFARVSDGRRNGMLRD